MKILHTICIKLRRAEGGTDCPGLHRAGWQLHTDCSWLGNREEIFYLTVTPPFPGSHLNMFLVKKENPPFFIPDPALPGRTYRPRASPVRVLLRRRVSGRYVLPQLASCGEMAIA
jgi:hypothetical protein